MRRNLAIGGLAALILAATAKAADAWCIWGPECFDYCYYFGLFC